ncbi:MAG: Flp pilus assembly protein TadG, partial [Clostridium sp.]
MGNLGVETIVIACVILIAVFVGIVAVIYFRKNISQANISEA